MGADRQQCQEPNNNYDMEADSKKKNHSSFSLFLTSQLNQTMNQWNKKQVPTTQTLWSGFKLNAVYRLDRIFPHLLNRSENNSGKTVEQL